MTTIDSTLPEGSGPDWAEAAGPPASGGSRRPVVLLVALIIVILLLAGGWVVMERGAQGYYEFSPGTAPLLTTSAGCKGPPSGNLALPNGTPCVRLMVPARLEHPMRGSLFMVDVLVGPATPGEYLLHKLHLLSRLHEGMQLIPAAEVLGSTPASQLTCQNNQEMSGATQGAAVVALRQLGYQVQEKDLGALIVQVGPGTPASAAGLQGNNVITAVDATAVRTAQQLSQAIQAHAPGDTVTLTVEQTNAQCRLVHRRLTARVEGTPALGSRPAVPSRAFLGVATQTHATYRLPVGVSIDVGNIGGPSAGLALSLGLLDVLSNGDLTGGHYVAATGTIDAAGNVGDVGGVAQKTVAVRRAGAQLFLVPPQELQVARAHAGPHMKVQAVATLSQALADLRQLGGHIPLPTALGVKSGPG